MPRAVVDPRDLLVACLSPGSPQFNFVAACAALRCELILSEHIFVLLEGYLEFSPVGPHIEDHEAVGYLSDLRRIAFPVCAEPFDVALGELPPYLVALAKSQGVSFGVSRALADTSWAHQGVRILTPEDALRQL